MSALVAASGALEDGIASVNVARRLRFARLQARRIAQTVSAFRNWPKLLWDLILADLGRGPERLSFHTRSGMRIDCPNRRGARIPIYEIFAEDCYRLAWFLRDSGRKTLRVLDIGAHVGTFACQLAQLNPNAMIDCFEPSAGTARYLKRNITQNGFAERISVTESAVGGRPGLAPFVDNGAGGAQNGLVSAGHDAGSALSVVPVETFADIVDRCAARVDLVKIDCEGGEYDLVLSSPSAAWAGVARVVIEYQPVPGHSWSELRTRFEAMGFRLDQVVASPHQENMGLAWFTRTDGKRVHR